MKKIVMILMILAASLFGLPNGVYVCVPFKIKQENYSYKLSNAQSKKGSIVFKAKDNKIISSIVLNYIGTMNKVDVYKNKEKNMFLAFPENPDKIFPGIGTINKKTFIYFKCEKTEK